jgi:hypothetical protein
MWKISLRCRRSIASGSQGRGLKVFCTNNLTAICLEGNLSFSSIPETILDLSCLGSDLILTQSQSVMERIVVAY